jgi:hypothetical protein
MSPFIQRGSRRRTMDGVVGMVDEEEDWSRLNIDSIRFPPAAIVE